MKYWQIIKFRLVTILLVFLLTAVTTTVVSFLMPKTYMSMSRISLEKDTSDIAPLNGIQSEATAFDPYFIQTELEVIQSQKILEKVITKCNLAEKWKRIYGGESLDPITALKILKKSIDIRQFRNTSIIELRAYDRKNTLARDIAKALAEEYQTHRADSERRRVEIIDHADLQLQAVRPNIPLNITLGVVAGLILGVGLAFFIEYLDQLSKRSKEKRTMQLASIAHKLNLPFFPEGDDSLLERLNHFHLLSQGHSDEIWNMLHGETNNVELAVFDYQYTTGSGEHSYIDNQSVIYFRSPKLNLPQFAVRPEGIFHNIGSVLGQKDIDFVSHPDFSKKYLLRGDDESVIRALFNNELLNYFESQQKISVEGGGDQLIFYRAAKLIKHEEVEQFMDEGFQAFQQFLGSA